MQRTKRVAIRVVVGVLLVTLAAGIAYIIRDVLASQNPVSGLPIMQVYYVDDQTEIPPEYCMLASYSWRFVNKPAEDQLPDPNAWQYELNPFPASPGVRLDIQFSFPCKSLKVSRWPSDREDLAEVLKPPFSTPVTGGTYVYRVEAEWGARGSVQYYIKVKI